MKKIIQINLVTLILAGLVILLGIGFGVMIYINKTTKLKDKIENEVKLRNALIDNVKFYQNKEKEWVAELRKKYKVVVNQEVLATVNKH